MKLIVFSLPGSKISKPFHGKHIKYSSLRNSFEEIFGPVDKQGIITWHSNTDRLIR